MNKIYKLFVLIFTVCLSLSLLSCSVEVKNSQSENYSIILPTGAPSIGLSKFIKETNYTVDIVSGSDMLVAAFTQESYDVIVAPVNLGVKFYNQVEDFGYILYRPIVGCNYYILSNEELSFEDLDGKEMESFNEAATPGVMLKTLCKYYGIEPIVHYNSSVGEVNPLLLSGKASIVLTAEPSKTVVESKKSFYSIDILALWQEMAGNTYNVPQAGIFIKKELINNTEYLRMLIEMDKSIEANPSVLAECAVEVDQNLSSMNVELLAKAIPNCHYIKTQVNKEEVNFYLSKIIELGLGKTIGNKLPDDSFYYKEN